MSVLQKFLVVDDVEDNRFLLSKTLLRKFPGSIVQECSESGPALIAAQHDRLSAAIVHRAADVDGITLIAMLRQANPAVPIIMVSGRETCPGAIEAGASAFLNYDAWLRIGTVVADVIAAEKSGGRPSKFPFTKVSPVETAKK